MTHRAFVFGLLWTAVVIVGMVAVVEWFDLGGIASGITGIVAGILVVGYGPVAMARRW
jgi:hypothetical protein